MIAQLQKELKVYFSGILGYLIIGIYLLINGLMLWVFNGPFNLLDGGYATLSNYFGLAPWVFLFLIPAVSMRVFSDELKSGMMELLIVRPISTRELVLAKFLGTLSVVVLSILPTTDFGFSLKKKKPKSKNVEPMLPIPAEGELIKIEVGCSLFFSKIFFKNKKLGEYDL